MQWIDDAVAARDDRAIAYKEKLLGKSIIDNAPEAYWELDFFLNLEGRLTFEEWGRLPIHDRARIRATVFLQNMIATLRRHAELQEDERKKLNKNGS